MHVLARYSDYFTLSIQILIVMCIAPLHESLSQTEVPSGGSDVFQISAREEELRRKEEELLRAMRNASSSAKDLPPPDFSSTNSQQPMRAEIEENNIEDSKREATLEEPPTIDEHPSELRALQQHPALAEKKSASHNPREREHSTIKTYPSDTGNDGTTARRLGTYTRVKPNSGGWQSTHTRAGNPHTVSLTDIESETYDRSMAVANPEIASTQGAGTNLRTGPSELKTNVVRLPPYSEVVIDYRSGNWYRVQSTSGARGWIAGKSLLFDTGVPMRSAVKIGAVRGAVR